MLRTTRSLLALVLAPTLLLTFLTMVAAAPPAGAVASGTVVGWGSNGYGQAAPPIGLSGVVDIAAGGYHSLAVRSDGTVVAWGADSYGQASVPAGLGDVTQVAAGSFHSLALKADGTVVAWGYSAYGQASVPADLSGVTAIAAGTDHNLALKADGTVVAWGSNTAGQSTVPAGLHDVVAVSAGMLHSLALKADGTVVAWGHPTYGGGPVPAGLDHVVAIGTGWYHNLAVRSDGTVVAWGYNLFGSTAVPAGLDHVVAVTGGEGHSLALRSDGTVVAWGWNDYQQATVPAGLTGVRAISGGVIHSLALVGPLDSTPPVLSLPDDLTVPATSGAGATVDFTVTATDDTDASPVVVCTPSSGATYPVGSTTVTCTATDAAGNSATGTFTVTVVPAADLAVTLSATPAGVYAGDLVTIDVAVTNDGPQGAVEPIVVLTLPTGLTFVSGDECVEQPPGTVRCSIAAPELTPGATTHRTVVLAVGDDPPSPLVVEARASSGRADPDESDNTGTVSVPVLPKAGLSLTKTVTPQVVEPGGRVRFTLVVRNSGPGPASNVELTDRLPDGLSLVAVAGATCPTEGQLVACHLGTVQPAASRTITLTATVDPVLASTRHRHELGFAKVETHLSLDPGETDTALATCPSGYLVTDGSVRIDQVDQGTGTFADVVVLDSRSTAAGEAWLGRVRNTATGRAQVKVNAVCVSSQTVSGEGHAHPLQVAPLGTSEVSLADGGSDGVDRACPAGTLAITPGFRFATGRGTVSSRRTGSGWHFSVTSEGPAEVELSTRCLSTALGAAAGHTHELASTQLQGSAVVPAGAVVERSLTCPVGAKGIVAWGDMDPGLVSMGNDPQPITRVFRFYNFNPTGAALGVDYGLTCLDVRSWDGSTTNTATVTTRTPDATTADDTSSATFTVASGGVSVGPTVQVGGTPSRALVRVHLVSTRARTVTVRLVAVAAVPGTGLGAGDRLAGDSDVRLVGGAQIVRLDAAAAASSALRHGSVDRAKLVVVSRTGTRTVRIVQVG